MSTINMDLSWTRVDLICCLVGTSVFIYIEAIPTCQAWDWCQYRSSSYQQLCFSLIIFFLFKYYANFLICYYSPSQVEVIRDWVDALKTSMTRKHVGQSVTNSQRHDLRGFGSCPKSFFSSGLTLPLRLSFWWVLTWHYLWV